MIFAKVDVNLSDHPKALAAGPLARDLWLWGLLYCRKHELDGALPLASVLSAQWGAGGKANRRVALKLVEVGLWEVSPDGWRIVGYADKNETKGDIEARRKDQRERKARWAERTSGDASVTRYSRATHTTESESESESESDQRERDTSKLEASTTLSHIETNAAGSAIPVDVAPGRATEAAIAPDVDPEPRASQGGEEAHPLPPLTLAGVDASPRIPADVQRVFDHWMIQRGRVVRGRGTKPELDGKRQKLIATQLRRWSADALCLAIDGACATPFNCGENKDGKVYLNLDLILRDAAHIEEYSAAAPTKAVTRPRSDQLPTPAKPAATDEELAAFFADNAPETFAPGSDLYDETEEAS